MPHYVERVALQKLQGSPGLSAPDLMPAGPKTISKMTAKGWIAPEDSGSIRYCITPAGEAALKAHIPMPRTAQNRTR